jgi:hypothetical protein
MMTPRGKKGVWTVRPRVVSLAAGAPASPTVALIDHPGLHRESAYGGRSNGVLAAVDVDSGTVTAARQPRHRELAPGASSLKSTTLIAPRRGSALVPFGASAESLTRALEARTWRYRAQRRLETA